MLDMIGYMAAVFAVFSYAGVAFRVLDPRGVLFNTLNVAAPVLMIVYARGIHAGPVLALQVSWILVALVRLLTLPKGQRGSIFTLGDFSC